MFFCMCFKLAIDVPEKHILKCLWEKKVCCPTICPATSMETSKPRSLLYYEYSNITVSKIINLEIRTETVGETRVNRACMLVGVG